MEVGPIGYGPDPHAKESSKQRQAFLTVTGLVLLSGLLLMVGRAESAPTPPAAGSDAPAKAPYRHDDFGLEVAARGDGKEFAVERLADGNFSARERAG